MSDVFIVPGWARDNTVISVYDLSGKLAYRTDRPGTLLNLAAIAKQAMCI